MISKVNSWKGHEAIYMRDNHQLEQIQGLTRLMLTILDEIQNNNESLIQYSSFIGSPV